MEVAGKQQHFLTARDAGLIACQACGKLHQASVPTCDRCGIILHSREPLSLQRVWAWWFAGLIAYVPANLYPMLLTSTLVSNQENTIVGGVVELIHYGSWFVALIIFIASVMIPVGKFVAIAYLALSVKRQTRLEDHRRHQLYEVVEFVGRWSMIDVFVVAILSSLVQLDAVATINPGPAAVSFALSVAFTMLAALSFDSRTIWDTDRNGGK